MSEPDHLFISYAWEDSALADWLTLRLTAAGYRVWCDRFQNLGGERWPQDIDDAIKQQTFRLIHLLSRYSLKKQNPSKERELALHIGAERGLDFLIPLNVDGTRPADLPWRIADIAYIPFQSWAAGLDQLLKKLSSIDAPKQLESGGEIAAQAYLPPNVIKPSSEVVHANILPVTRLPEVVKRYRFTIPPTKADLELLGQSWAFRRSGKDEVLAFTRPPTMAGVNRPSSAGGTLWRTAGDVDGVRVPSLLAELLRKSVELHALQHGMRRTPDDERTLYFPPGALEGDKLRFLGYGGKRTTVRVTGLRDQKSPHPFRYHLACKFFVRGDLGPGYSVVPQLRLHITEPEGKPLDAGLALTRRKRVAKSWWNHEWINRLQALLSQLSNGEGEMRLALDVEDPIVISTSTAIGTAAVAIDEGALSSSEDEKSRDEEQS